MLPVTTVLFALLTPPSAFDLDCRTWPGGAKAAVKAAVKLDVVAVNGTRETFTLNFTAAATVDSVTDFVREGFDPPRWQARKVSDTVVRVRGKPQNPILFLTATSKQWAPDVSRHYAK
jgi:hypothetical protein